jgi:hypothetical protein
VEVHIEELVLHGFKRGDRHRISDALQEELARLFEARGFASSLRDGALLDQIDGGTVRMNRGASTQEVGIKTAEALHNGMSHLGKPRARF